MNFPIPVTILGATGLVGQRLVQMLENHPWFRVQVLAASDNSAGKKYSEATRWRLGSDMPVYAREMMVQTCEPSVDTPLVFSALPSDVAGEVEDAFANAGAFVSSNASNHRMDADVPLVISEVNPGHLELVRAQRARRNGTSAGSGGAAASGGASTLGGAIVCNANCSTIHLTLALKPLADRYGLRRVIVTTMQALSGAGYPGVASLDILDNVIPYIGGEEGKLEREPLKILGALAEKDIAPAAFKISAACNRVATSDGHLETVSIEFVDKPELPELVQTLAEFCGEPQLLKLPTAPVHPILVRDELDRPQPRLDRDVERGMATVVGRVRECSVLDYKLVLLGHNTIRGAAGGTLLNAELLAAKGYLA